MARPETSASGVIAALIVGVLVYGLAMGTTYPLLGIVLSETESDTRNGLNAAATGLGLLVGVALVPSIARRVGAGQTALVGVLLMGTSLVALALAEDFWLLFAARFLLGCGANLMFVVAETALNVFAVPERRGRIMGAYSAAAAVGFVIGPAIVAVTPGTPMLLLLACAGVTLLALLPLAPARGPLTASVQPAATTRILPAVISSPFAFGFLFIASAVDAVAVSLLPVIALDQAYTPQAGALFVTIFHVGLAIGQPLVGMALDSIGRRRSVLGCCLLSLACTLALVFGADIGFWAAACLMLVWGGANYGLYTAGLALIGDRFRAAALTAATAAFAAVYAVAAVVSPLIAGALVDHFGAGSFYLGVAGLCLTALLCGAALFHPAEPTRRRV